MSPFVFQHCNSTPLGSLAQLLGIGYQSTANADTLPPSALGLGTKPLLGCCQMAVALLSSLYVCPGDWRRVGKWKLYTDSTEQQPTAAEENKPKPLEICLINRDT